MVVFGVYGYFFSRITITMPTMAIAMIMAIAAATMSIIMSADVPRPDCGAAVGAGVVAALA